MMTFTIKYQSMKGLFWLQNLQVECPVKYKVKQTSWLQKTKDNCQAGRSVVNEITTELQLNSRISIYSSAKHFACQCYVIRIITKEMPTIS